MTEELQDYYDFYEDRMLFNDDHVDIPKRTKRALDRWACWGEFGGDFITAVLTNDLFKAVGRADLENKKALNDIVNYIYNNLPRQCWGSVENVEEWEGLKLPETTEED